MNIFTNYWRGTLLRENTFGLVRLLPYKQLVIITMFPYNLQDASAIICFNLHRPQLIGYCHYIRIPYISSSHKSKKVLCSTKQIRYLVILIRKVSSQGTYKPNNLTTSSGTQTDSIIDYFALRFDA